jgi:hypothetical protein
MPLGRNEKKPPARNSNPDFAAKLVCFQQYSPFSRISFVFKQIPGPFAASQDLAFCFE